MSLRKIAGLLAAFGLTIGLIGGGVGAQFHDSVTATENISVGTFGCAITDWTPGSVPGDLQTNGYHSVTYTAPPIQSSAAGTAPFSFTVSNTGSIGAVLSITASPVGGTLNSSKFSAMAVAPASPVNLAVGASQALAAGIQWTTLDNTDLGDSGSVTWTVNCGEAAAGPAIGFQYFTTTGNGDSPFHRYSSAQTSVSLGAGNGTASQVVNLDGSITLSLSDVTGYGDTGFYVPMGPLGTLPTYTITASSGTVATNLYLDTNNDGVFGSWTGDSWNSLAGDAYGLGSVSGASLTVNGSFLFNSWSGGVTGDHTVTQLQGLLPGTTQVWAWVGIQGTGSLSATITAAP